MAEVCRMDVNINVNVSVEGTIQLFLLYAALNTMVWQGHGLAGDCMRIQI